MAASSGEQALEMPRGGVTVDLVVTDFSMPVMSGLQLATELDRLGPGMPLGSIPE